MFDRQALLDWARDHPLFAFSGTVGVVATARLVAVSRGNRETMAALIQHSDLSVIGTSFVAVAWSLAFAIASFSIGMKLGEYLLPEDKVGGRGYLFLMLLSCFAIGATGIFMLTRFSTSVPEFVLKVSAATILGLLYSGIYLMERSISQRYGRELSGTSGATDRRLHPLHYIAKVRVGLFTVIYAIVVPIFAMSAQPWHPRETIQLSDVTLDGYVLEDSGRWMTVMQQSGRELVIIEIDDVVSRSIYEEDEKNESDQ